MIEDPYNPFSMLNPRIVAKEKLLEQTLDLTRNSNNILLEYSTGSGKSNNAIQIHNKKASGKKVLLVVAEILHYEVWREEYIKFGHQSLLKDVKMICYHSLSKEEGIFYDMIIFDEIHHGLNTEGRINALKNVKSVFNIFLSATLTKEQKETLKTIFPNTTLLRYTLKDALEKGAINDYKIVFLECDVNNGLTYYIYKNKNKLKKGGTYEELEFKDRYKRTSIPSKIKCTASEYIQYYVERAKQARKRMGFSDYETKWFLIARLNLKNALAEVKTHDAGRLLKYLESQNKRFICFTNTIDNVEKFSKEHGIHSKKSAKVNLQIFNDFQDKKINSLYVVNKLTEGMNPNDVNIGVITQLDNTLRIYEQKTGRIFRGESPVIYVLYLKDTLDESYIQNVTENIDFELIEFSTVKKFLNDNKEYDKNK